MAARGDADLKGEEAGVARELWQRAPLWRSSVYLAGIATAAALIFWANDEPNSDQPKSVAERIPAAASAPALPPAPPSVVGPPTATRTPTIVRASGQQGGNPTPHRVEKGAPVVIASASAEARSHAESRPQALVSVPRAESQIAPVAGTMSTVEREEEEAEARCHPHLLNAPASMPQINVGQSTEPSIDHMKIHFWVNGAGRVVREMLTATNFATAAEQQMELEYTRQLTFTVPNTPECASREIELVGDFFENRESSGQWATYVRLYPRFSFTGEGVVASRD
jgi:hypothetical protein